MFLSWLRLVTQTALTTQESGDIQQFAGLLSLQFVGPVGVLGQGAVPVNPALAKALDEHPVGGHPQQNASLQVTEEAIHGFGHACRQGHGARGRERELLGAAGAVDAFVSQGDVALQDEASVRAPGGHFHDPLALVQQHHLQAKVCAHAT